MRLFRLLSVLPVLLVLVALSVAAAAQQPTPARSGHTMVVFNGELFMIGGWSTAPTSEVWTSDNATTWTLATPAAGFAPRFGHASVVFNKRIWVIGGWDGAESLNDVWSSDDGSSWRLESSAAAFPPRLDHACALLGGRIWLSGGNRHPLGGSPYGDLWSSADGVRWERAFAIAPYGPRTGHTLSVFKERLTLVGGYSGAELGDVWTSPDGLAWERATAAAGFEPRSGHAAATLGGQLFAIGGWNGRILTDAWASDNATTWTQLGVSYPPVVRRTAVRFGSGIWLHGGFDGDRSTSDTQYVTTPHAQIDAAPAELLFTQAAGMAVDLDNGPTSRTLSVRLSSVGDQPLEITDLALEGTGAAQFAILAAPALPQVLATTQFVEVQILFASDQHAAAEAWLVVRSNDLDRPSLRIRIEGEVIGGVVNATRQWVIYN